MHTSEEIGKTSISLKSMQAGLNLSFTFPDLSVS